MPGGYARIIQLVLLSLALAACAAQPSTKRSVGLTPEEILEGAAFGISEKDQLPPVDVLAVNDDMRAFLQEHVPPGTSRQRKVELILGAILQQGLHLDYHSFKTLTAEQAFYQREGNCLSFTNLFVALAREAGLDVEFQEVDVPPSWDRRGDSHLFNRHINARVRLPFKGEQAVDFDMAEFDVEYTRRRITDEYAKAQYHNNMAIYWLDEKQLNLAYLNIREAISLYPEAAYFWTNLGTLHRRVGDDLRAEAAWLEAVRLADEPSAISNLARLYEQQGKKQQAKQFADAVESYRRKNPYYLYRLGEEAYQAGEYGEARSLLRRAVRLREDEHEFYRLLGLSYLHLGDETAALRNFNLAEQTADNEVDRERYNRKQRLLVQVVH
jgi:Flp pilus assembly protein TadD